jgi:choice-of-anchor A domain-containing protein/uncharacterized repeat protein (TIGR01451 family)
MTWTRRVNGIGARRGFAGLLAAGMAVALSVCLQARADNPVPVQTFYLPIPEPQFLQVLKTIAATSTPKNPMQVYASVAAVADNTIIYYDHWENGFDPDIANPLNVYSAANPGGTQIWGDGDPSNGAPPGVPGDIINAGTVFLLNNAVDTAVPGIRFDGRDKIATTKSIAVTRAGWASESSTMFTGANEVFDTGNWGTSFRVPVGEDIPDSTDGQIFEYVGLSVMAGSAGTLVEIDKNADGLFETSVTLGEGEAYLVNGGLSVGAALQSSKPVQVDLMTGDIGEAYECRFFRLLPTVLWADSYYTPVATPASAQGYNGIGTTVWLYNPHASVLQVTYTRRSSGGALTPPSTLTVPAGGYLRQEMPTYTYSGNYSGAAFSSLDGRAFYALSAVDSTASPSGQGQDKWTGVHYVFDWGFALVPRFSLTSQVLIGLGIGRDPLSSSKPNENGNPIWVTTVGNGDTPVTVYVDFDADPTTGALTDAQGNKYDMAVNLRELEIAKIYDTAARDQTGTLLYTLDIDVKLAAAWGQDPLTASGAAPGLDAGTAIPPLPMFAVGKNGTLHTDNDGDGFLSPGDRMRYTIAVNNVSRVPVPDIRLIDMLPEDVTYIPDTTFFTDEHGSTSQIADDTGEGTPFPLDGEGYLLNPVTALPTRSSYLVTFDVLIKPFEELTPGLTEVLNEGVGIAVGATLEFKDTAPLAGRIGDFVWYDSDGDGLQDEGEAGIAGVTVLLFRDVNGDGALDDGDQLIASQETDAAGGYLFTGVFAGNYLVTVSEDTLPEDYALTSGFATAVVSLVGGQIDLSADFGYRSTAVPNASIGDRVWEDLSRDGVQDPDEPGLVGVTVTLLDADGQTVATTVTDGDGYYLFAELPPGTYRVRFALPGAAWAFTEAYAGSDAALDSDADLTGLTGWITLAGGQNDDTIDAGMYSAARFDLCETMLFGNYFNAIVFGDFEARGGDTEGRLAVAGNASLTNGYSVGIAIYGEPVPVADAQTDHLIVGGDLYDGYWPVNGNIVYGNTRYGPAKNTGIYALRNVVPVTLDTNGNVPEDGGGRPFGELLAEFRLFSALLAGFADRGAVVIDTDPGDGKLEFVGSDPDLNVFNVTAEAWSLTSKAIHISAPAGSTVLFNIRGDRVVIANSSIVLAGGVTRNDLFFNYVDAVEIVTAGFSHEGSVLAPYAGARFSGGSIQGVGIFGGDVYSDNGFEFHNFPFVGTFCGYGDDAGAAVPGLRLRVVAGDAADGAVLTVDSNATVTVTYTVQNTGNVWLRDVRVTDDAAGEIGVVEGPLAPGASAVLTRTITHVNARIRVQATAAGRPSDEEGTLLAGVASAMGSDIAVVDIRQAAEGGGTGGDEGGAGGGWEKPDFAVTDISFISKPTLTGEVFAVVATVDNHGDVAADAGILTVYLSEPVPVAAGTAGAASLPVGVLQPGETRQFEFTLQAGNVPGTHHVRAFVDSEGAVTEYSDGDNQRSAVYELNPVHMKLGFEGGQVRLDWNSYWGQIYTVMVSTNGLKSFEPHITGIEATPPSNTVFIAAPPAAGFFKLRVDQR